MSFQTIARCVLPIMIVIAAAIPLQAQPDPNAVLNDLQQAQAKSQARDWAAAAPLWERLVAGNPHVGWWWYSLGTAQFNIGEYRKAIPSFEKSLELGTFLASWRVAFDIARSQAGLKEKDASLDDLHEVLKLMRTLPLITKYQRDHLPGTGPLQKILKEYQRTEGKMGEMVKK